MRLVEIFSSDPHSLPDRDYHWHFLLFPVRGFVPYHQLSPHLSIVILYRWLVYCDRSGNIIRSLFDGIIKRPSPYREDYRYIPVRSNGQLHRSTTEKFMVAARTPFQYHADGQGIYPPQRPNYPYQQAT